MLHLIHALFTTVLTLAQHWGIPCDQPPYGSG
jgi:hypothetical protein